MFGTNAVFDDLVAFPYPLGADQYNWAFDAIENLFMSISAIVNEQLSLFVDTTDQPWLVSSAPDQTTTQELDEFGTPNPQKIIPGQQMGFPLRKFGASWQVTFTAMEVMTGAEIAAYAEAAATAVLRRVQERIRNAFYSPTNYLFTDKLVDRRQQFQLPVKALANADGFPIPIGPNGEVFDATIHNHYLATAGASRTQADFDRLIIHVMEHHRTGKPMMAINQADVGFVKGFTTANGLDNFAPLMDARVIQPLTQLYAVGGLDVTDLYNRLIGYYNGVEVYTKPWALPGYPAVWQGDNDKPLMRRERRPGSSAMRLVWDGTGHPLHARVWESEFDIAVYNRVGAAVLDSTHQTTYQIPTWPAA